MATFATEDGCTNVVASASDEPLHGTIDLSPPNTAQIPDDIHSQTELRSEDSISIRRGRSLTAFLFEEIAGKRLKCYEKWKLWLVLFIVMTVIAVGAIILATVFAVKYSDSFKSQSEAAAAQNTLLKELIHDETSNFTDHTDEARKIFNTFDDDNDGVWNREEFTDHFVLTSGTERTFDHMDQDGDDIISWKEIVISMVRYSLTQSYMAQVQQIYNYTIANASDASTDALLNQFAANIYLNEFNIEDFGYITRSYYDEFRSNISFNNSDIDENNVISFDEYSATVGDESKISYLRNWNLDYVIESLNYTPYYYNNNEDNSNDISSSFDVHPNMCPIPMNSVQDDIARRLIREERDYIYYEYLFGKCVAKITCYNYKCNSQDRNILLQCTQDAFDNFMRGFINADSCLDAVLDCVYAAGFSRSCDPDCWCTCNGQCSDVIGVHVLSCNNCPCGCTGCDSCDDGKVCFSGDNEMVIKRDDMIQNILLKDMKIGDYVQTEWSEWSKVFFIKKDLGDFEFLKLYFGDDEYITMTDDHLLYVYDEILDKSMLRADQVRIGDMIFVMNDDIFINKEIINIESVISSEGAYVPITMDGSVVVSKVLSSCYAQSPEFAQTLHDAAAIFRWISSYNTNLAAVITSFFYDIVFMGLRDKYGLEFAFTIFNGYSTPFIVVSTAVVVIFVFARVFSFLS